jgi:V/A-type H+-transporting ATPase subunit C
MSIAPVYQYLRDKLHEIDVLTTIIEGVRYRIPPRDIQESIFIV